MTEDFEYKEILDDLDGIIKQVDYESKTTGFQDIPTEKKELGKALELLEIARKCIKKASEVKK